MVNWWAVIAGTALNMFLGFLWYGPLFGRWWLRLMEKNPEEISDGNSLATYAIPIVGAFVSTLVLAVVISFLRVYTWWSGMGWGAGLSFAFGGTGLLTTSVFEDRKQGLSWMFISYMVVVHGINGAILATWR